MSYDTRSSSTYRDPLRKIKGGRSGGHVPFKFLAGDVNWEEWGGKWISKKLNNGEFDYWLVIELVNMEEATGDTSGGKYMVTLSAVSPEQAKDHLEHAFETYGQKYSPKASNEEKVEVLHGYGVSASLWNDMGDDADDLIEKAKKEAEKSETLFGFYMDKPENRIGDTGWDFIRGDTGKAFRKKDDES